MTNGTVAAMANVRRRFTGVVLLASVMAGCGTDDATTATSITTSEATTGSTATGNQGSTPGEADAARRRDARSERLDRRFFAGPAGQSDPEAGDALQQALRKLDVVPLQVLIQASWEWAR